MEIKALYFEVSELAIAEQVVDGTLVIVCLNVLDWTMAVRVVDCPAGVDSSSSVIDGRKPSGSPSSFLTISLLFGSLQ